MVFGARFVFLIEFRTKRSLYAFLKDVILKKCSDHVVHSINFGPTVFHLRRHFAVRNPAKV